MPSDRDGCVVNENYVEDDNYFDDDIIATLNDTHAPINKELTQMNILVMKWVEMRKILIICLVKLIKLCIQVVLSSQH